MHRTQIYLQDDLYDRLKARSRAVGLSISELIRRSVEKDIKAEPLSDAQQFFAQLVPLDSFADVDAETYVRSLRNQSRLLTGDIDGA